MAVSTSYAADVEVGNGTKDDFDFAFKIFSTSDLSVYKETAAGVFTAQSIVGDWGVETPADNTCWVEFDSDAETGTVHYSSAPESGLRSVIFRATAIDQDTVFSIEAKTAGKTYENAYDKAVLMIQELDDKLDRAVLQPALPPSPDPISIDPLVDGKALKCTDNGDGTWTIEPTTTDIDTMVSSVTASAAEAAASALAAAGSASAAATSAAEAAASAAEVVAYYSGTYAAKPATLTQLAYYYSTDRETLELWVPPASKWFFIG